MDIHLIILFLISLVRSISYRGFVSGNINNTRQNSFIPSLGWGGCIHEPQISGGTTFNGTLEPFPGATLSTIVLNFRHSFELDLAIFLESPNGQRIALSITNGQEEVVAGQHESFIIFQDSANQTIVGAQAPFIGVYRPDGRLIPVCRDFYNVSGNIQTIAEFIPNQIGVWKLIVFDISPGDSGQLLQWRLIFGVG